MNIKALILKEIIIAIIIKVFILKKNLRKRKTIELLF